MKLLSLLRHAKSDWDDRVEPDFDRPLNERGARAARRMGEWLGAHRLVFDRVLASPALRVRRTIEGVEAGLGAGLDCHFDRHIYLASAATLFDLVRETPNSTGHLLLIGHSPGLEDLLFATTRGDPSPLRLEAEEKYPTATYARIRLPIAGWQEARVGVAGRLEAFVRPRDLDPSLGPDR